MFSKCLSLILIVMLISPIFIEPAQVSAATSPLWSKQFNSKIDWLIQTEFDVIIAGSDGKLFAISERRGEQLWSIESGPSIERDDVSLIEGTDLLVVNREIEKNKSYNLEAYETITGNKLWQNSKINGNGIAILPILERWSFLYLTDADKSDGKVRPHIYNINVFNGKTIWESEFNASFDGTKSSGFLIFENKYDVSGYYPPVFINDEIYFFYDGIRKFNYKTGKQSWYASYKVNKEDNLVRTDADAIITDNVIYTSGAGVVRAIDRKDGSVLWASEEFSVVPLIFYDEGKIYGQIGGSFIKANLSDVDRVAPVGAFALNAKTGDTVWKFWNCQEPITNIVPVKDKIFMADKLSLIAIDKKTGKDTYKTTLDFENPVFVAAYDKANTVLVQSGQKVGSYKMDSGHKQWFTGFKEQTPGFLDKLPNRLLIGTAIIIFTGGLATVVVLGSYAAYDINRSYNRNSAQDRLYRQAQAEKHFWGGAGEFRNTPGFMQASKIRKERLAMLSKQKNIYLYVYGEDEGNSDIKGVGGVNIDTGKMDFKVNLENDKPAYHYDRIYGLLFYTDGKNLSAYKLY